MKGTNGEMTKILDLIDLSHYGKLIKQARLQRQMTREDVAKALDVTTRHIYSLEKGDGISLNLFLKIAKYFNISIDRLLFDKRENESTINELYILSLHLGKEDIKCLTNLANRLYTLSQNSNI